MSIQYGAAPCVKSRGGKSDAVNLRLVKARLSRFRGGGGGRNTMNHLHRASTPMFDLHEWNGESHITLYLVAATSSSCSSSHILLTHRDSRSGESGKGASEP